MTLLIVFGFVGLLIGIVVGRLIGHHLAVRETRREPEKAEPPVDVGPITKPSGEPRAFDEGNPPHYTVYNPDTYNVLRAPRCSCHNRPIEKGEKVLLWPIPDHPEGGIDIFCEQTYGVVG
jgi:hypothetical protein